MKKSSPPVADELRAEYKASDFPEGLVRGKYAARIGEGSNIVVLEPEVALAFPASASVNSALRSLLRLANTVARPSVHAVRPRKSGVATTKRS